MTDEENNPDEQENEEQATDEQSAGGKKKLIILAVLLVVLAVAGYFAAPYVFGTDADSSEAVEEVVEAPDTDKAAIFTSLHPPLVVNFRDAYDENHFMQITLEVMAREQSVIDEVKNFSAVIRNSLILMYGNVDYDFITQREGKEKMLADALAEIQIIIERETGEVGVEAVFFTSLIIQ